VQRRRARPDVVATDAPLHFGDEAVRFVEFAALDDYLGQPSLGLDEVSLLVRRSEPADGLSEGLLCEREVAAPSADVGEVGERPAVAPCERLTETRSASSDSPSPPEVSSAGR
jgi:hypothetical protein